MLTNQTGCHAYSENDRNLVNDVLQWKTTLQKIIKWYLMYFQSMLNKLLLFVDNLMNPRLQAFVPKLMNLYIQVATRLVLHNSLLQTGISENNWLLVKTMHKQTIMSLFCLKCQNKTNHTTQFRCFKGQIFALRLFTEEDNNGNQMTSKLIKDFKGNIWYIMLHLKYCAHK